VADRPARDLAERFQSAWLAAYPFAASSYGIPGYDDRVPDQSEAGDATWRGQVEGFLAEVAELRRPAAPAGEGLCPEDAVTLGCVEEAARQEVDDLDSASSEHTVTAMPFDGPAQLLAVTARTILTDEHAASDYLARLGQAGGWLDRRTERLRIGAAKGRLPVAPLVEQAIAWGESILAEPVPDAIAAPRLPEGFGGGEAWLAERDRLAAEVLAPAMARWVQCLRELLPASRPADRPGLVNLPGGEADYAREVRSNTTLDLTPEELHRIGLDEVERLERRGVELGAEIGLDGIEEVRAALRGAAGRQDPQVAIEQAVAAIRRAEARAGELFPAPLPPPCAVTPMPPLVAASGMAPHYTPPRLDGSRPGTFWFNTERPTAGTGWDLEVTAFHEAVPGHHLQLSRIQMLGQLTSLQRQRSLTVFSEGWGLYAEQLAEEAGLYVGTEGLLGAVIGSLMRAVRLVVDTGLHAFGWSRERAYEHIVTHVPMPEQFLAAEIDRYITIPGQALAYLTGKREIVRLREEAQRRLGPAFSLPGFHAAVLDQGSLPMPVLQQAIASFVDSLALGGAPGPALSGGSSATG